VRTIETISIGGEDREVKLRMIIVSKILVLYNKVFFLSVRDKEKRIGRKLKDSDSVVIPNYFYFWSIWKILVKKGFWPFRRPFRSRRKMIKEILSDEFVKMVTFIGEKVLNTQSEDKEQENSESKNDLPPQNTMTG
jgi:hypothetical protein